MKAHIVYDCDGTSNLHLRGRRITSQLFDSGKTLIRVYRRNRVIRCVQLGKVHSIDIDKRSGIAVALIRGVGGVAAGAAVGAVLLVAAGVLSRRSEGAP